MLDFVQESWLSSRYISVDNDLEKLDVVAESLLPLDVEFITQINWCIVSLGKDQKLSIIDSCYQRKIHKFNQEKCQDAVIYFGYVVDFNPEFIHAYYHRGLTYIKLQNYLKAVVDFTKVLELDYSHALAYNYRGNTYYKLAEYQQEIDNYDQAVKLGLTEAVKHRDVALNIWQEKQWEAEEKRQREKIKQQQQAQEKMRLEKIRRQQQQAQEKILPEEIGEVFTFEVVTVNNSGTIINRTSGSARQKIEDLDNGIKLEMVYIPQESFLMGSLEDEKGRNNNQSPQHQVILQPFYMCKYPITQDQYQAIIGKNPSHFKRGNRPVERVKWYNTIDFCQRLSEKTRKTYTLLSESQWEYACRAGMTTPFYFGLTITPNLVNYDSNNTYGNVPI
ncbi:SUMF1/EgtB/PvdO family nonheme iron enzyme [Dapis sp. BLCC M126]|uniref:SUMF1/EgtB/PvdO family nonheme iron enzyme n=1 Tax=Dapis sp. BLCC M126 TaxID=3400189 RepID=UPI003CF7A87A